MKKYISYHGKNKMNILQKNERKLKIYLCMTSLTVLFSCSQTPKVTPYTIAYESSGINIATNEGTTKLTDSGGYAAWSPDGKRIAFYAKYDERKTWSIHTINSDGTNKKRLTHVKNKWDSAPSWSPDGKKIAFAREYTDSKDVFQTEIWLMNADGSNQAQIKSLKGTAPSFTKDGRIVYNSEYKDKKSEISIANMDGSNIVHLTDTDAEEWNPEVSPDAKHIAFMSNRDGLHQIYTMNIDGANQKRLTHNTVEDWHPSWSPDGSKVIFVRLGERWDIYTINKDGSSEKKIIEGGTKPAWLKIYD
jgi:TolB protein